MKRPWFLSALAALLTGLFMLSPLGLIAQNDGANGSFGFDDFYETGESEIPGDFFSSPGGAAVKINGEVKAELRGFFDDFRSGEKIKNAKAGDIFSGALDFSVSGSAADGVIKLTLAPVFDASPVTLDEAYVRAYFGPVSIEGGLRKLTWGKADSFGPLDIINPLDYSDLSALSDPESVKISRPLLRLSWNLGSGFEAVSNTKLEAVFVPWFRGHTFADSGRWAPGQISAMPGSAADHIAASYALPESEGDRIQKALEEWIYSGGLDRFYPDTETLRYAQAGLRFTATLGSSDWGIQYYFGRLPRPAVTMSAGEGFYSGPGATIDPEKINLAIDYNSYHQIGIDFARVMGVFNFRAEAGANITNDSDGTAGAVYNPHLFWCLGFDRDLFWGINANVQATGNLRLFHDKIGESPLTDTEAGKTLTSTRITLLLSKKFLGDELEIKAAGFWGIEDKDFLIMPSVLWSRNGLSAELSAGFFGGNRKGELGQYRDNNYIKASLGYSF